MRDEIAMFKAVQAARGDVAEGINAHTAIRTAAQRYGVNTDAVAAYTLTAHHACCRAASEIEAGEARSRPSVKR